VLFSNQSTDIEKSSAIQQRAISPITQGWDVVAQAQCSAGKTARFPSPSSSQSTSLLGDQALVLSPTRELAMQI
jgi:superfamily II DNA/RNA helicase